MGHNIPHTAEANEKNRQAHLGKRHTKATRKKMGETRKKMTGNRAPRWNGGRACMGGYILLLRPEHPNCNSRGYILEHRLVMSEHLGRPLLRKEVVHHINGIRNDNRIKNLKIFSSTSEHSKHHYPPGKPVA